MGIYKQGFGVSAVRKNHDDEDEEEECEEDNEQGYENDVEEGSKRRKKNYGST